MSKNSFTKQLITSPSVLRCKSVVEIAFSPWNKSHNAHPTEDSIILKITYEYLAAWCIDCVFLSRHIHVNFNYL